MVPSGSCPPTKDESRKMISPECETRNHISPVVTFVSLSVIGCLLVVLYRVGLQSPGGVDIVWFLKVALVQSAIYLAAAWLIWRARSSRSTLVLTLVFAALFRLSVLFAPPYLSDDIYRYIWDGRVQAAGINPYRYIPADEALKKLRDEEIYPKMNHRDTAPTIYPPVAEVIYFLTTRVSESVTWMKTTMVLFEGLGIWAIVQLLGSFGLPRQRILIYAWHPLTVWEFAGSGHLDAMIIGFLGLALLARRRHAEIASGLALASATLVKFFPAVLLPTLYKRWNWKMPAVFAITILVAYLPYLGVGPRGALGFLFGYARERGMESGEQFFLLSAIRRLPLGFHVPTAVFVAFAIVILGSLAVWMMRRQKHGNKNFIGDALVMATAFTVLVAPHFPWYFAWLIPFLCFFPSVPVFYLTLSSLLLYLTWLNSTDTQVFKIKAMIFVPFFFMLAVSIWLRRRKFHVQSAIE
jgi:alpha-1,6-mannosyltransferase